jgi:hypothetical protein
MPDLAGPLVLDHVFVASEIKHACHKASRLVTNTLNSDHDDLHDLCIQLTLNEPS